MRLLVLAVLQIAAYVVTPTVFASELEFSGYAALETRAFFEDPLFPSQESGVGLSPIFQPELRYEFNDGRDRLTFVGFARFDSLDDERTHVDVREANWLHIDDQYDLVIGFDKIFWGVTESRHLVNIVNQIDNVEDIDEEAYLGELMVKIATQRDWGAVSLLIMPGFRERRFPGPEGRLRLPFEIDESAAQFESDREELSTDVALRYAHFFGAWDLGLYYFYGTSREPRLLFDQTSSMFFPFYDRIQQWGMDVQYTSDAWLWKFEGIVREGQGSTFGASVAGFEYTQYQIFKSDADLGFIMEYLYDGRDETAPVTPFQNDLFYGTRLVLNDIRDTSILAGGITDLEDGSTSLRVEGERRLGNDWRIELEAQFFADIEAANTFAPFEKDSYLTFRLSRFF